MQRLFNVFQVILREYMGSRELLRPKIKIGEGNVENDYNRRQTRVGVR